jgi:hypothetical protein
MDGCGWRLCMQAWLQKDMARSAAMYGPEKFGARPCPPLLHPLPAWLLLVLCSCTHICIYKEGKSLSKVGWLGSGAPGLPAPDQAWLPSQAIA